MGEVKFAHLVNILVDEFGMPALVFLRRGILAGRADEREFGSSHINLDSELRAIERGMEYWLGTNE